MKPQTLKLVLWGLAEFVGLVFLFQHQILFFLDPQFLTPDEDSASTLKVHQRHFFTSDTVFEVKARHVDWREEPDWCAKAKDGSWNSYFRWDDGK